MARSVNDLINGMNSLNLRDDGRNHPIKKYILTEDHKNALLENLNKLSARTGYNICQLNGQRIYSAPGIGADEAPPKGCEVFVGKIPRNMFEDELVPIFEKCGKIFQFRLMMDFSGHNRGYGFLSYYTREEASEAVRILDGYTVRYGRKIGVYKSVDNCRLFVGGVPLDKNENDIKNGLSMFVDGIVCIIMYRSHESHDEKYRNRGFAFIEFECHKMAAMARRKLSPGSFILWGVTILVDWADPIPEVDPEIMKKVTKLYIRNLGIRLSRDQFHFELLKYLNEKSIIKTYKSTDYAFVHFLNREFAEEAMKQLSGVRIDGELIEVEWARPKIFSKNYRRNHPPNHFCTSLPPRVRKQIADKRPNSQVIPQRVISTPSSVSPVFSQNTTNSNSSNNSVELSSYRTPVGYPIRNQNIGVPLDPNYFMSGIRNENSIGAMALNYSPPIGNGNYINSAYAVQGMAQNNFGIPQLGYMPQQSMFAPNIGSCPYFPAVNGQRFL